MKRTRPGLRQINIIVITLAVLFGPITIYYLFYFSNQKDYFITRNFRLLSSLGSGIENKFDAFRVAYGGAASKAISNYYKTPGGACEEKSKNDQDLVLKHALNPVRDVLYPPVDGHPATNNGQYQISRLPTNPQNQAQLELVTLEVTQTGAAKNLVFNYARHPVEKCDAVVVSVNAALDKFVGPFFRRFVNAHDLDAVFLTDANGQMLYQWSPDDLHLTNISTLAGKNGKVDFDQLKQNDSVADITLAENDYKIFLHPIELSLPGPDSRNKQNVSWTVVGLVRTDHLLAESRSISYTVLIIITFLFILIVISLPFLKLVFMGPKDVLRVADVYFLAFAILVGSALLTAFLLFGISYLDLEAKMDSQLEGLSQSIKRNFDRELSLAVEQLKVLQADCRLSSELEKLGVDAAQRKTSPPCPDPKVIANFAYESSADTEQHTDSDSMDISDRIDGCRDGKPTCLGRTSILNQMDTQIDRYPFFTTLFLVDSQGKQRIKWTTRSDLPTYLDVSDRAYFTNLIANRGWKHGNDPFMVEPVYSRATGQPQVVLSMPMPHTGAYPEWVSAVDLGAYSLVQTVLPDSLGYGYAVIDNDGRVLFHSDDSRNLVENFFRETDNSGALRTAVLARDGEGKRLDAQYQGGAYRLFVSPIPNTSWTLITFREKQKLRSAAVEFVAYAVYFFCLYALALLLVFGCYYLWYRDDRSALLWPYQKRKVNYYLSISFNLIMGLIFLSGIVYWDKWMVVPLIVVVPLSGFLFHHYNVRRRAQFGKLAIKLSHWLEHKTPLNYQHGYVLTLVTLLLLVSVLPMMAFFTFAYDREMKLLVRLGQMSLAQGIENRADRIQHQLEPMVAHGMDPNRAKALLAERLDRGDVYCDFFFKTGVNRAPEGALPVERDCFSALTNWRESSSRAARVECFGRLFDSLAPFQNSLSVAMRGQNGASIRNDGARVLHPTGDEHQLVLQAEGGTEALKNQSILSLTSTPLTLADRWSLLWRLGVVAILLMVPTILFVLIRFVGQRIFLLGSEEPIFHYRDELNDSAYAQDLFLVASRYTRKDDALKRSGLPIVDLRLIKTAKDWSRLVNDDGSGDPQKGIAINHFEYNLDDPVSNLHKLKLIEHHLALNNRVIVASTADLSNFNFTDPASKADENGNTNGAQGIARPLRALDSLRRFSLEDRGQPKLFRSALKKYVEGMNLAGRQRKEIRRIERLRKAVKRECQSRAFLQQCGYDLLKRGDFILLDPNRISWRIQDRCDGYYHALWDTCSTDEKFTLVNLANHQLVSSHNPSLPGLLRRGLIFRDPFLRPMNESFSRFIASQATPEKIQNWRGTSDSSVWEILRVPLLIALVVIAGFLFVSQRDLYNSTLAFVSAFAAVMPILFKFLGMFPAGRGMSSP